MPGEPITESLSHVAEVLVAIGPWVALMMLALYGSRLALEVWMSLSSDSGPQLTPDQPELTKTDKPQGGRKIRPEFTWLPTKSALRTPFRASAYASKPRMRLQRPQPSILLPAKALLPTRVDGRWPAPVVRSAVSQPAAAEEYNSGLDLLDIASDIADAVAYDVATDSQCSADTDTSCSCDTSAADCGGGGEF